MLASATTGAKSRRYLRKAKGIEAFLRKLIKEKVDAYYQLKGVRSLVPVRDTRGEHFTGQIGSRWKKHTGQFAVQGRFSAFFMPDYAQLYINRAEQFSPLDDKTVIGVMPCGLYGRLATLDTALVDERGIMQTLEASLPYHVEPSYYNPMPYTMVEVLGVKDGEYHDIRPQAFSAGPFQAAVTNLALHTMPFGIALRGTNYVKELKHFEYMGRTIDVRFRGSGEIRSITLNGAPLANTLQIPDKRLQQGANRVVVSLGKPGPLSPTLVSSTVRLLNVSERKGAVTYRVQAYAQNVLLLSGVSGKVVVRDSAGKAVKTSTRSYKGYLFVEFDGCGRFSVVV
jgi:hypothetical protein